MQINMLKLTGAKFLTAEKEVIHKKGRELEQIPLYQIGTGDTNRHNIGFQYKQVYKEIQIYLFIYLSWFLKTILHQKELGLFKETADFRAGAEKGQDEPETSHHARSMKELKRLMVPC